MPVISFVMKCHLNRLYRGPIAISFPSSEWSWKRWARVGRTSIGDQTGHGGCSPPLVCPRLGGWVMDTMPPRTPSLYPPPAAGSLLVPEGRGGGLRTSYSPLLMIIITRGCRHPDIQVDPVLTLYRYEGGDEVSC